MIYRAICLFSLVQAAVLLQDWPLEEQLDFSYDQTRDASNITFYLFNDAVNGSILDYDNLDELDVSLPFIFYLHGFSASVETSRAREYVEVYRKIGGYNFVAVDWSIDAGGSYLLAVINTPSIGYVVGEFIYTLHTEYNVSLDNFHVIGHSLSSHIAGHVGRAVQNLTGGSRIARVTSLDAVNLGFLLNKENRINAEDAEVVVAVHSSQRAGFIQPIATIDFYPNGGWVQLQPGCTASEIGCGHARSEYLFLESVENSGAFLSKMCDTYINYLLGKCDNNNTITLGGKITREDAGIYYFNTNAEYPFSQS